VATTGTRRRAGVVSRYGLETRHHPRRRRARSARLLAPEATSRSGPLRSDVTASVLPARRPRRRTELVKMLGQVCGRAPSGRSYSAVLRRVCRGLRDVPGLLPWPALLQRAMPADGAAPAPQGSESETPAIARRPRRPPRPTARLPRASEARARDGSILRGRVGRPYALPKADRACGSARQGAGDQTSMARVLDMSQGGRLPSHRRGSPVAVEEQVAVADYVKTVMEAYVSLPGTPARPSRRDRRLARELYGRGFSLETVRTALLLAAARRTPASRKPSRSAPCGRSTTSCLRSRRW
jgi:hypothetical protein